MFALIKAAMLLRRAFTAAGLLAFVFSGPAAKADNEQLSFEATPKSVDGRVLSSAEAVHILVRLKAGALNLSDIKLSSFSNDGITATIEGDDLTGDLSLPALAEHIWKLRLVPGKGAALSPVARTLNITASFKEAKAKDDLRQRYMFTDVKINPPAAFTVSPLVDVDIKGSLDALSHERPRQLFVVATNKYSQPLTVVSSQVYGPEIRQDRGSVRRGIPRPGTCADTSMAPPRS